MKLNLIFSTDIIKKRISKVEKKIGKKRHPCSSIYKKKKSKCLNLDASFFKTYQLKHYKGISIPKTGSSFIDRRPLLIPFPEDRIALSLILDKLKEKLDSELRKYSVLGFGMQKNEIKKTIKEISENIDNGYNYILVLDFKNFFCSIDRNLLLQKLSPFFDKTNKSDCMIFSLIKKSINNPIKIEDKYNVIKNFKKNKKYSLHNEGVPQGLPISSILATFFATEIDFVIPENCLSYRYIDDMVVLAKNKEDAMHAYKEIKKKSKKIKLSLHPLNVNNSKTQMINLLSEGGGFMFLGFEIKKDGIKAPIKAKKNFIMKFKKIKDINSAKKNFPQTFITEVEKRFNLSSQGWIAYYANLDIENVEDLKLFLIEKRKEMKRLFLES